MGIADTLISRQISEKETKGEFLTGKQVAALVPKQAIFVDGKRAVVVSTKFDTNRKVSSLVYVVGRKAFGVEKEEEFPFSDMQTAVQIAISSKEEKLSLPYSKGNLPLTGKELASLKRGDTIRIAGSVATVFEVEFNPVSKIISLTFVRRGVKEFLDVPFSNNLTDIVFVSD